MKECPYYKQFHFQLSPLLILPKEKTFTICGYTNKFMSRIELMNNNE